VATDSGIATPRYSQIPKGTDGALTFCVNAGEALFLVVVATPSTQQQIVWDHDRRDDAGAVHLAKLTLRLRNAQRLADHAAAVEDVEQAPGVQPKRAE
jgi:hypothetical protein